MNKNGILRNYIRRRFNFWKRNISNIRSIRNSFVSERINPEFLEIEINNLCHEIDNYECNNFFVDPSTLLEDYTPLSFNGDWMGKVITKDGKIYRGIYEESRKDFGELWKTGIIQVLSNRGYLPDTYITHYYSDLFPIILEHKCVNISTSKSWSYEMIRDAALTLCIIRTVLLKFGYTLHDAHLNNITFSNGRFVFTDLGSIKKYNPEEWDGFPKELVFAALYKLLFLRLSNSLIKRQQIFDEYNNAIWFTDRFYDDATIECYNGLKMFKRHLFFCGQWGRLIGSIKLFDFYLVEPSEILRVFPDRKRSYKKSNGTNISIIKNFITEVYVEIESICIIDSLSESIALDLDDNCHRIVMVVDNDEEADALYNTCKKLRKKIDIAMRNIMYGCDEVTSRYCLSDMAIVSNLLEKTKGFHNHSVDSSLYSLRKLCKKYAIISYDNDKKVRCEIDVCKSTYFTEIKEIEVNGIVYCLLKVKD